MMWVLALDTSSPASAAAVLRDGQLAAQRVCEPSRSHVERLPRLIDDVVADAGLTPASLDLLCVASGPGAFTGLRVGLASIQALGMALDRPTVAVPTLAAVAWRQFANDPAMTAAGVWLNGARGDVFSAAYARPADAAPWPLVELAAPTVASPAATLEAWSDVDTGALPILYGLGAPGVAEAAAAGRRVIDAAGPLAEAIGRIGAWLHSAGQSGPPHALAPLYVRRPDAVVERERRQAAITP